MLLQSESPSEARQNTKIKMRFRDEKGYCGLVEWLGKCDVKGGQDHSSIINGEWTCVLVEIWAERVM